MRMACAPRQHAPGTLRTMLVDMFPEDIEMKVLDEIREKLKEIDISVLTPLEALNILQFLMTKSD